MGGEELAQVGMQPSSIFSVGAKGKRSVMCAGTPCWADQSCFARHSCTSGSASGTSTISALPGRGGEYAQARERRRRADHVAPEGVVAARARDLPEPALGLRRASRRLGRSGRGAAGAGARDHHPRRDRGCADDLSRRRVCSTTVRFDGWNVAVWAFLGGIVYGTIGYWLGGLLVHALASGLRAGSSYRQARHVRRLRRGSARPLAPPRLAGPASRSTETTSSGPAAPILGPATGSSTA